MKKIVISALIGVASLFAAMDQWVESGELVRYRHSTHFSAVGMSSESSEAAKNNALAEVRKQISVEVKSTEISKEQDFLGSDGSYKKSNSFQARTRLAASGDMQGAEIIETTKRPEGFYAFAALSKELFVKNGRAKIVANNKELKKRYKAAQRAIGQSDVITVMSEVGEARKLLKEIVSTRTLLTAATVVTEKDSPLYTSADLNALYESVILSLEVKKTVGMKQEVTLGGVPSEPFIVTVSVHGQGVPYMPFILTDRNNKEILRRSTNISGDVVFFLGEDAATAKGKHSYKVVPAIPFSSEMKMRKRELTSRFTYSVLGDPSFAKVVVELPEELEKGRTKIESSVKSMLAKYDIIHDSCACQKVEVTLSAEAGEYIQGVSESRTLQKSSVNAVITVKDKNGRSLHTVTKSAKGTGSNFESSVAKGAGNIKIKEDIKEIKAIMTSEIEEISEAPEKKKIVIFDFQNGTNISNWYETAESITSMVTTEMINTGYFEVIERDQIAKVIAEKNFAGDEIDFAKLAGADYAVVGNAFQRGRITEIDARLIDMETGAAVGVSAVTGYRYADLRKLSKALVKDMKVGGKELKSLTENPNSCCE